VKGTLEFARRKRDEKWHQIRLTVARGIKHCVWMKLKLAMHHFTTETVRTGLEIQKVWP
jgi:hypothetical protein